MKKVFKNRPFQDLTESQLKESIILIKETIQNILFYQAEEKTNVDSKILISLQDQIRLLNIELNENRKPF